MLSWSKDNCHSGRGGGRLPCPLFECDLIGSAVCCESLLKMYHNTEPCGKLLKQRAQGIARVSTNVLNYFPEITSQGMGLNLSSIIVDVEI